MKHVTVIRRRGVYYLVGRRTLQCAVYADALHALARMKPQTADFETPALLKSFSRLEDPLAADDFVVFHSGCTLSLMTPRVVKAPPSTKLVVYTDGSCRGNPGPAGWAWSAWRKGKRVGSDSGALKSATNNAAELRALIEALKHFHGKDAVFVSDSGYVVNGCKSLDKWRRQGFPVVNTKAWERLGKLLRDYHPPIEWVKGHNGNKGNTHADSLAGRASRKASRAQTNSR